MPDRSSANSDHRVVQFRHQPRRKPSAPWQDTSPVDDLRKFEQAPEADDYRHRMITNVAAASFTLLLIFAGLWLADALSAMRKDQDCVLSGRRGCTPVEVPLPQR